MPDAALNEAENVKQPKTIVTHRWLEVNPKASAAWMRRLSGHAMLGGGLELNQIDDLRDHFGNRRACKPLVG